MLQVLPGYVTRGIELGALRTPSAGKRHLIVPSRTTPSINYYAVWAAPRIVQPYSGY